MVAPFFGCTFGGFLYDVLLFTGESPINTPYWGLYRFIPAMRHKYDDVQFHPEYLQEDYGNEKALPVRSGDSDASPSER